MPLYRYEEMGGDIERICEGCRLKETKPGWEPIELAHWIAVALSLDSIPEGSRPKYPEVLTIWEWTALQALEGARNQVREKEHWARQKDPEQSGENARLEALVNRGRK